MIDGEPIPLIVFAKTPQEGHVKTRLQPKCSTQESVYLARIMLRRTLENAVSYWPGKTVLSIGGNLQDDFIQDLAETFSVDVVPQQRGDLGCRMYTAFEKYGYPAAIMGSDVPHCPADMFVDCSERLRNGQNVIGPSRDGGYYLIGLQKSVSTLFSGVEWGSAQVFDQTLKKADLAQFQLNELMPLQDLDTWQDLLALAQEQPNVIPQITKFVQRKISKAY